MYSVMWSEHCSYKSSKVHLRQFADDAPPSDAMLVGIGENAGVVDVGDGLAVTFKVESHNHPSYVEPYQGAATGVGGIVRDILTMGARPIAVMDSLRFGDADRAGYQAAGAGDRRRRRWIRQLPRPAQHRRRGGFRPDIRRQPAGQRVVRRRAAARPAAARTGPGAPATRSSCSGRRPAVTASAGSRCWPAQRSTTTAPVEAAERAGRRPVHREDPDRVLPRALRRRPGHRHPGSRRRRACRAPPARPPDTVTAGCGSTLDRVPLREASMSPLEVLTSESQERMLADRRAGATSTTVLACAHEVGRARDGHRRGHRRVIGW